MAIILDIDGPRWEPLLDDGYWSTDYVSKSLVDELMVERSIPLESSVGSDWHKDEQGAHRYRYGEIENLEKTVFIPPDPEYPEDEGYFEYEVISIDSLLASVAGDGYSEIDFVFSVKISPPDNKFWTGLQLATETP